LRDDVNLTVIHHRHHCEDLAPANFASTLPVLDRLFGTSAATPRTNRAAAIKPGDAATNAAMSTLIAH